MEYACGKYGVSFALQNTLGEVLDLADAAARDNGNVHCARHGPRKGAVEPVAAAVSVHAREQDLARAAPRRLLRPLDGVDSRCLAAAVDIDLPFVGVVCPLLRVDRTEDRLRAERGRRLRNELGFATAAEFTDTLSAPAAIILRISATLRNPPPTQ